MSLSKHQRAGEEPQLEQFRREALVHMDSLYSAARYMAADDDEAEDLVQDTFLRAYRFWHRYEPGTNCKAWLFRILTNTLINKRRRKQPAYSLIENADSESESGGMYEQSSFYWTPENQYLSRRFPEKLRRAVDDLPDNFRIPVVLADLQDFSYKEIAEIMDCPVGTVMSRLFRGRKRLQHELFGYAVEQGVVREEDARDENGAISLEAYRARKKAASGKR